MAIMSGGVNAGPELFCPEYVLVADKVVYVISGKNSQPLIPLADVTPFRLQKNQMLIRVDDAAKESRFQKGHGAAARVGSQSDAGRGGGPIRDEPSPGPDYCERATLIQGNIYLRGFPTRCAVANMFATVSMSLGCTFPAGIRMCVRSSSFSNKSTSAMESISPEETSGVFSSRVIARFPDQLDNDMSIICRVSAVMLRFFS